MRNPNTKDKKQGGFSEMTELAKELALVGGKRALKAFKTKKISASFKKNKSMITSFDFEIEGLLRKKIAKKYPHHNIYGEEERDKVTGSEYCWYIDPIDGTGNFALNLPVFCTIVGATKNDAVIAAAIYDPINDFLYWAEKGKGAYRNGKKISIGLTKQISQTLLFYDRASDKRNLYEKKMCRFLYKQSTKFQLHWRLKCTGIALGLLASGKIDALIVFGSSPYELVAGSLLVSEAGGLVVDEHGKDWYHKKSSYFIAMNKYLKSEMVKIVL